jgi:hypothetical protein
METWFKPKVTWEATGVVQAPAAWAPGHHWEFVTNAESVISTLQLLKWHLHFHKEDGEWCFTCPVVAWVTGGRYALNSGISVYTLLELSQDRTLGLPCFCCCFGRGCFVFWGDSGVWIPLYHLSHAPGPILDQVSRFSLGPALDHYPLMYVCCTDVPTRAACLLRWGLNNFSVLLSLPPPSSWDYRPKSLHPASGSVMYSANTNLFLSVL